MSAATGRSRSSPRERPIRIDGAPKRPSAEWAGSRPTRPPRPQRRERPGSGPVFQNIHRRQQRRTESPEPDLTGAADGLATGHAGLFALSPRLGPIASTTSKRCWRWLTRPTPASSPSRSAIVGICRSSRFTCDRCARSASTPRVHGGVRAIGFYGLLCQLANEQRHVGDHVRVRAGYDELCARGRTGASSVKALLDILVDAGVVRVERLPDRRRGTVTTVLHLAVHEPPWMAVTVAMAEQLACDRADGHLLRDLGAVIVLLDLCAQQRDRLGGLQAEVMRADLAACAGLSVDSLDRCNRALERAGVLRVDRRREGPGGRHLPSVYTVVEAAPGVAAKHERGGRKTGEGWPQTRRGVAANEEWPYRNAATPATEMRPSNARAGCSEVEKRLELPSPQTPLPPPAAADARGEGEGERPRPSRRCARRCWRRGHQRSATVPAATTTPTARRWLTAAHALLERHPHQRLADALDVHGHRRDPRLAGAHHDRASPRSPTS